MSDVTSVNLSLFRFTLGLKAQKHIARAERKRRPELITSNNFRPARAKALLLYYCVMRFFSKLSNKICTIKVKILIFVSSIKRTKK